MWMDWNDPDELRRLRDLLAADPGASATIQGPDGPVTDTRRRCSSGGSGMPELGGSYFTFSNENNDPIWGFLKECHRRGWLYKGHDTMPWCARCGTGHLPDGDERGLRRTARTPGLTVRFPLVDRPGEDLLVWTTTPWTLTATSRRPSATGAALRQGPPGRRRSTGSAGDAEAGARRAVRGPRGAARPRAGRLALRRPVRRPARRPAAFATGTRDRGRRAVRAPRRRLGRGRRGRRAPASSTSRPGCGAEDFQLGKALGLPPIAPLDDDGDLPRRLRLADRAATSATSPTPIVERPEATGPLLPPRAVSATATRTAGAARRRCSSGSSTSGSSPWARSTTSRARR